MSKLYILCCLLFAFSGHAQESEDWTKDITPKHSRISGTNAYFILDIPGWAPLPANPNLLVNEEKKAYMFIEQKKASLEEYESDWIPILLGDIKPLLTRQIRFKDEKGKLIKTILESDRGEEVLWLAYIGNQDRMLDIKAAYASDKDDLLEGELLTLIRSLFIDEQVIIGPFETVPFIADVERHGFVEEASYMPNSLMITNPETMESLWMVLTEQTETREEILQMDREYLTEQEAEIIIEESWTDPEPTDFKVYNTSLNNEGISTFSATIFMENQVITVSINMPYTPANEQMFREILSSVRLK